MGLTTPPRKKGSVTETRTDSQPLLSTMGEDGDSDRAYDGQRGKPKGPF